ncbi:aldehyde dehydrogenase family protein [Janibacter sp. GXQ6167]|uniref:aldehyde dehydrogenase family protein n=1 Tax=Janibacter sp. GXQ6167 TaxID=3240791 RepID=UPI0035242265
MTKPYPDPQLTAAGAIERARAAAPSLARPTIKERVAHLARLRSAILARREEIIDVVQADTRKSRSDILVSEIFGGLDVVLWCEKNAADALADEKVPTPLTMMGKKSLIAYEPLGVLLVISPWNYPFYQAIAPIALAIAAGDTVVYKPSEHTPLTGLIESLLEDASFAPNWVQIIYGDGAVGADLLAQGPDKVMFTGSTATGKKIMAAAAEQLIPVELELGGKDAMIVFDDVDIDRAVAGALWGGLTSTGQSCTSVERIYVQDGIYDVFVPALVAGAQAIKQVVDADGDGDIGGMVTEAQVRVVAEHIADAKAKGATVRTGADWDGSNPLIPPMVITDIPGDALIASAETFGPVLPVYRFTTEAEAIERANASDFGLTGSVWSKDLDRATRVARALRVGGVSINNVMATEATPALPFGGVGNSGMGRYKGVAGLRAFAHAKSMVIDKDSSVIEANWFPYTKEKHELFTQMMLAWFSDRADRLPRFALFGTKLENYSKKARR